MRHGNLVWYSGQVAIFHIECLNKPFVWKRDKLSVFIWHDYAIENHFCFKIHYKYGVPQGKKGISHIFYLTPEFIWEMDPELTSYNYNWKQITVFDTALFHSAACVGARASEHRAETGWANALVSPSNMAFYYFCGFNHAWNNAWSGPTGCVTGCCDLTLDDLSGFGFVKVIQNGVKPFLNETVKKSCFHVELWMLKYVWHFQCSVDT